MHALATWEPTGSYDPNRRQHVREQFAAIPGTYASWYWNRAANTAQLDGAGFTGLARWQQIAIVAGLAGAAGYLGLKHVGPKVGVKGGALRGWFGPSKARRWYVDYAGGGQGVVVAASKAEAEEMLRAQAASGAHGRQIRPIWSTLSTNPSKQAALQGARRRRR